MKKILLAAAVLAVASINSFAAACAGTGTLADYSTAGSCTVTVGSYNWTLTNFGIYDTSNQGFSANISTADLQLTIAPVGSTGFSLTYSDSASAGNFFSLNNQDVQWRNNIWITGSSVIGISNSASVDGGDAYMAFKKVIQNQDPAGVTLGTAEIILATGGAGTYSVSGTNPPYGTNLSINDRIVFDAGNGRSGLINSYTNTFYAAQSEVPEPMTFVLMGVGLVGIAALRRRNG